jgi:flagellar motor switch protein FliN/FliY
MTTDLHKDWIVQIRPELYAEDDVPLLGSAEEFPWDVFSTHLQKTLQLPALILNPKEFCWRSEDTLTEGLGDHPQTLHAVLAPLEGFVSWIMPDKNLWQLFTWILGSGDTLGSIPNPNLQEGLHQFIAAEVFSALSKQNIFNKLSPQLVTGSKHSSKQFLCLDIGITVHEKTIWGRLCLSSAFRRAWKQINLQEQQNRPLSTLGSKTEIVLGVDVGQLTLSSSEWNQAAIGDLVVVEACGYDPELKKGTVHLSYRGKQLFRGKLRNDEIKLTEHPIYFEELAAMDKDDPLKSASDDDEFDDFDEEEEDLFLEDEELAEALAREAPPKKEDEVEEPVEVVEEAPVPAAEEEKGEEEETISSPSDIPLTISVEIARLRMTVKQLLELSPGNHLSLNKEPDNFVNLMVNGKCIGKGELLRIGEVLGIRILEL